MASPASWSEVRRFSGSGTESYTTDYFICDHVEWRIRWQYTPLNSDTPEITTFSVYIFPREAYTYPELDYTSPGRTPYIASINGTSAAESIGISHINDVVGSFYPEINVEETGSWLIIVEQDLHSIPEFSSILIIPLSLIVVLLAFTLYRKRGLQ